MSVEVIKAGIADSFQDGGRYGYQHVGINPTGAMDLVAMKVANALVGNELNETVLELCFPASTLLFRKSAWIAFSGADFSAELNGQPVPINQSVWLKEGSELKFTKIVSGVFCYLAIRGGFELSPWLESNSTNTKANAGGLHGRSLQKGDVIDFRKPVDNPIVTKVFPWRANVYDFYSEPEIIRIIRGNEFEWLDDKSREKFSEGSFAVTSLRDRMGYRLKGEALTRINNTELISTVATFGTVQLLPDGQLIVLMADHQTTGGYPRMANVVAADRSKLAQRKVGAEIYFREVSLEEAEELQISQQKILKQIQVTCTVRLKEFIK